MNDTLDDDLRQTMHRLAERAVPTIVSEAPPPPARAAVDPGNEVDALSDQTSTRPRRERMLVAAALVVLAGTVGALVAYSGDDGGIDGVESATIGSQWQTIAPGPLSARENVTSVWTDAGWFIWGGEFQENTDLATTGSAESTLQDGAMFDPDTNTWREIASAPIEAITGAPAVWIDDEVFVFAGRDRTEVAAYQPASDSWRQLADAPAPVIDAFTGDPNDPLAVFRDVVVAVVVLPGEVGPGLAGYQPEPDLWSGPASTGLPANAAGGVMGRSAMYFAAGDEVYRVSHVGGEATQLELPEEMDGSFFPLQLAWNGRELVILAGHNDTDGNGGAVTLARYDPLAGSTRVAERFAAGPISEGYGTDSSFISFDNRLDRRLPLFDYGSGEWGLLPAAPIDLRLLAPARAWTGERLLVWGGRTPTVVEAGAETPGVSQDTGAMITITDPTPPSIDDTWTEIAASPLSPRENHSAVWTGEEMIVWGGQTVGASECVETGDDGGCTGSSSDDAGGGPPTNQLVDGASYDPRTDTWRTIAPPPVEFQPRTFHRAAWTGTEMLVWGGSNGYTPNVLGAAYDPATFQWRLLPDVDIPGGAHPELLWDGDHLWVFTSGWLNGQNDGVALRYDPAADAWVTAGRLGLSFVDDSIEIDGVLYVSGRQTTTDLRDETHVVESTDGGDTWTDRFGPIETIHPVVLGEVDGRVLVASRGTSTLVASDVDAVFHGEGDPPELPRDFGFEEELGFRPLGDEYLTYALGVVSIGEPGSWDRFAAGEELRRRHGASAVWTGDAVIVWGGRGGENGAGSTNTGASFRPAG